MLPVGGGGGVESGHVPEDHSHGEVDASKRLMKIEEA
jgi:hypothetical protein